MLIFGSQVIAVILAVFLHHGNGRAITSSSSDKEAAEEESDTILNESNQRTTEREENLADVLGLSEPDSQSYQVVQSQFSSDNMIQPKEASPILRQKRSHAGPCYTCDYRTVQLASGGVAKFPICRKVALTGCASSIPSYQMRLCVASLTKILIRSDDGSNQLCEFAKNCSCAA